MTIIIDLVFSMSHLSGLLGICWAKFSSKRTDSSNITLCLIGIGIFTLAGEVLNNCLNLGSCKMLYLKIGFCQHRFAHLWREYLWFGFDNSRVSFMMCFFYEPFFRGLLGICRAKFSSKMAEVYSFQQTNGCIDAFSEFMVIEIYINFWAYWAPDSWLNFNCSLLSFGYFICYYLGSAALVVLTKVVYVCLC